MFVKYQNNTANNDMNLVAKITTLVTLYSFLGRLEIKFSQFWNINMIYADICNHQKVDSCGFVIYILLSNESVKMHELENKYQAAMVCIAWCISSSIGALIGNSIELQFSPFLFPLYVCQTLFLMQVHIIKKLNNHVFLCHVFDLNAPFDKMLPCK